MGWSKRIFKAKGEFGNNHLNDKNVSGEQKLLLEKSMKDRYLKALTLLINSCLSFAIAARQNTE